MQRCRASNFAWSKKEIWANPAINLQMLFSNKALGGFASSHSLGLKNKVKIQV